MAYRYKLYNLKTDKIDFVLAEKSYANPTFDMIINRIKLYKEERFANDWVYAILSDNIAVCVACGTITFDGLITCNIGLIGNFINERKLGSELLKNIFDHFDKAVDVFAIDNIGGIAAYKCYKKTAEKNNYTCYQYDKTKGIIKPLSDEVNISFIITKLTLQDVIHRKFPML